LAHERADVSKTRSKRKAGLQYGFFFGSSLAERVFPDVDSKELIAFLDSFQAGLRQLNGAAPGGDPVPAGSRPLVTEVDAGSLGGRTHVVYDNTAGPVSFEDSRGSGQGGGHAVGYVNGHNASAANRSSGPAPRAHTYEQPLLAVDKLRNR
jgi:hypothetical protein